MEVGGGKGDAVEVGQGVLVVPDGDAALLLEPEESAVDGVQLGVDLGIEPGWPTAGTLAVRRSFWTLRSGMVCGTRRR